MTQKRPSWVVCHSLHDSFPIHPGLLERCHEYIFLTSPFHIAIKTNTVRFETSHIVREKPQARFSGSSNLLRHSLIPESSQLIRLENLREYQPSIGGFDDYSTSSEPIEARIGPRLRRFSFWNQKMRHPHEWGCLRPLNLLKRRTEYP